MLAREGTNQLIPFLPGSANLHIAGTQNHRYQLLACNKILLSIRLQSIISWFTGNVGSLSNFPMFTEISKVKTVLLYQARGRTPDFM